MTIVEIVDVLAALQNNGGVLIGMAWLVFKVTDLNEMVKKHNDVLFPKRTITFKED